jgi:nucleoside-diphosphate-sugar epimerase
VKIGLFPYNTTTSFLAAVVALRYDRVFMRVLVTGHLGYIGTVMVPLLRAAGHEVVGLDTDFYAASAFAPLTVEVPSIKGDIRDVQAPDLLGFDAVLHLAALSNDPLGNLDPDLTYDINHRGTIHLAEAAKSAGVPRFIFSSSCSNYGASGGDSLLTETAELNPVTPYGKSKVLAETDLRKLADARFTPVYMRSATAYGVSPRIRFDIVLNNLTAWAVTSGEILIKSDGTPWRPIVHIEDISRAFLAALQAPATDVSDQAFNVGRSTENYRVRELADIVKDTVPGCRVAYAADASPDLRNYRVSCDKIARLLPAFQPQWTARRGAQQLYETFVGCALSVDDFEGPRYRRIDRIKGLLSGGIIDRSLRWTAQV